jgi:hypothetical protein
MMHTTPYTSLTRRQTTTLRATLFACLLGCNWIGPAHAAPVRLTPAQIAVPNFGQHLVDAQVDKHPEVVRLALHITPPGRKENAIVASNFGRIGKVGDQADIDALAAGVTFIDPDPAKKRLSIYPMLHDKAGRQIGMIGVVFDYKEGDDKAKLQRIAEKIRDEMDVQITDLASLFSPWP